MAEDRTRTLEHEARLFSRYLLGAKPPEELVRRYALAHEFQLQAPVPQNELHLLDFVVRHPWSLGPLDAACAILQPDSLLRKKLLLAAAVLEASPHFADQFLPEFSSWYALPFRLITLGMRAVGKLALGLPILALARRGGQCYRT